MLKYISEFYAVLLHTGIVPPIVHPLRFEAGKINSWGDCHIFCHVLNYWFTSWADAGKYCSKKCVRVLAVTKKRKESKCTDRG